MKIIGGARVIDFSEDGKTCRVRLCDATGLPTGRVLTDVSDAACDESLASGLAPGWANGFNRGQAPTLTDANWTRRQDRRANQSVALCG